MYLVDVIQNERRGATTRRSLLNGLMPVGSDIDLSISLWPVVGKTESTSEAQPMWPCFEGHTAAHGIMRLWVSSVPSLDIHVLARKDE